MKPDEGEDRVKEVFTVRNRPVGYSAGRWGGALVAVERGDFPISPTGFRSLSDAGVGAVTPGLLENLAAAHERERESVLRRMHEARQPVGNSIMNYIHVSCAYEQGIQHGFFATDRDRRALWNAANQLLCMVDTNPRFQPVPQYTFVAWTRQHCDEALAQARKLKTLLQQLAAGEFPTELPMRILGANAYLALPPKPGGEPKVELTGCTAEMALQLPVGQSENRRRTPRVMTTPAAPAPVNAAQQLGLFDSPSVALKAAAAPKSGPGTHC